MTLSINFSKDMAAILRKKAKDYDWKVDWPADGERWLVDVAGIHRDDGPWILVEVELKRDDPVGECCQDLAVDQTAEDQNSDCTVSGIF